MGSGMLGGQRFPVCHHADGTKGPARNRSCPSPLVLYWAHLAVHGWRHLLSFGVRETEKIPLTLTWGSALCLGSAAQLLWRSRLGGTRVVLVQSSITLCGFPISVGWSTASACARVCKRGAESRHLGEGKTSANISLPKQP